MRVVLLGPPGAGKGTQAKRLRDAFGMVHLSSGDIFRAEKASGSDLGKIIAEHIDRGELVPDDIVVEMMTRAVLNAGDRLLLDGFPRTVVQAQALDAALAEHGTKLDAIILIEVDDDEVVQRITGRRLAPQSGRIYHVQFNPPKTEGVCDETGETLIQRADDHEDVVRQRLEVYHARTQPVVDYYRGCDDLEIITVVGTGKMPDDVTAAIFEQFND